MRRWIVVCGFWLIMCASANAQEDPTVTPTSEPYVYATLFPEATDEPGQMTRFDYVATAGDVQISNLLYWQLYSMWGMFFFWAYLSLRRKK